MTTPAAGPPMTNPVCAVSYRRSRFSTKLPADRLYTPGHFWLREVEPGLWRVGITRFAQRMLGDLVEYGFEVKENQAFEVGDIVGWIEAFKATSDIFSPADGAFVRGNPTLETDPRRFDIDPYNEGWLFEVRGTPDPRAIDADGYTKVLDLAIDRILGKEAMMDTPPTDEVGDENG